MRALIILAAFENFFNPFFGKYDEIPAAIKAIIIRTTSEKPFGQNLFAECQSCCSNYSEHYTGYINLCLTMMRMTTNITEKPGTFL